MAFNYKVILKVISILLLMNAAFMLLCIPFSLYYGSDDLMALLQASGITAVAGILLWLTVRKNTNNDLRKKDGYLIVTAGWLSMSFFGSLPYILSGAIPDLTNAFFGSLPYILSGAIPNRGKNNTTLLI